MASTNVMKGLQFQPLRMNGDALGTLAADTALIIQTGLSTGLTQSFLLKQLQYNFQATGMTPGDSVILGLANGTATIAEIEDALRAAVVDPDDASSLIIAANKSIVFWESLVCIATGSAGVGALTSSQQINTVMSIGGGKGIPGREGAGFSVFVYNPATVALTTGSAVAGLIILKGVWLND